jgi:hypothetical protein
LFVIETEVVPFDARVMVKVWAELVPEVKVSVLVLRVALGAVMDTITVARSGPFGVTVKVVGLLVVPVVEPERVRAVAIPPPPPEGA